MATTDGPRMLQDLKADLMQGCIEDEFEFAGRKWRMHTLSDGETVWAYQYVTMASNMALLASRKASTLAAAISHVGGATVAELFPIPEDPQLKGFLKNNGEEQASFYREKMYAFLSELPDRVVTELYLFFEGLEKRREEVIKNLKNSSKETSTSTSSSTSSPADGLPARTPGGSFGT